MGCVLALWLTAWVMHRRLADWSQTWMATTLFATLPWFFVATGWLAYFDSWLVLGLLITVFVPSRVTLALACLLTPWIDERFIIALPATLAARTIALARVENRQWRELLLDISVIAAASVPYPAVRALAWLQGDPDSSAYIAKHWEDARGVALGRYLEGLFSGYRAGWIMIVAAVWFWARAVGWKWGVVFGLVVLVCSIGGLFIAADMSRTLMIECPLLLVGTWLWCKAQRAELPLHPGGSARCQSAAACETCDLAVHNSDSLSLRRNRSLPRSAAGVSTGDVLTDGQRHARRRGPDQRPLEF